MRFDSAVPIKVKDAYRSRTEPEAARFLGTLYWTFLILLFGLLAMGSVGYGLWEFLQPHIKGDAESVSVTVGTKKTFTKSSLQKVLQDLDDRAREYDRRKIAPVPVRDPS